VFACKSVLAFNVRADEPPGRVGVEGNDGGCARKKLSYWWAVYQPIANYAREYRFPKQVQVKTCCKLVYFCHGATGNQFPYNIPFKRTMGSERIQHNLTFLL